MKSVIIICLALIAMLAMVQSVPVESVGDYGLFEEDVSVFEQGK